MSAPTLVRRSTTLLLACGLLAGALAAAPAASAQDPSAQDPSVQRRGANPTGTAAGSAPNGAGYLETSLETTSDGRIRVGWTRPGPASRFKKFVVQVSPTRKMNAKRRNYEAGRKRQSLVVPRAFNAVSASGNYSFVKVYAYRANGKRGSSATKWIQAPVTSPCSAAPADRVTVGAFNMRTWSADRGQGPRRNWTRRGDNVVSEILRSGAHAIAIQEASGAAGLGFGPKTQRRWVLDKLNATDPDASARWVDALDDAAYKPPRGRRPGLVGTRVFYDASKYTELASGLGRITDRGSVRDSLIPWARLRARTGGQAPFVLTSNHLRVGTKNNDRKAFRIRSRQTAKTISYLRGLQGRFGDQVILAGDLNSTANIVPYNNVQRALLKAGFYDAYASAHIVGGQYTTTNDARYPLYRTPLRRDYILTLGSVTGSCSYRNQYYLRRSQLASDHFMQVASLPLPPA